MNKKQTKQILSIILAIGLAGVVACEGPTGSDGAQGPQGEQGLQGEPGTANVIYSDWMDIDWNYVDSPTNRGMYIEEPRVLGDFMSTGTLAVYIKSEEPGAGIVVLTLPYLQGNSYFYSIIADVPADDIEGILMAATSIDGVTPLPDLAGVQIRYVLIPGGVPAKMANGFFEDYEAVADYFGFDP